MRMSSITPGTNRLVRFTFALMFCVAFVSGCSSSSTGDPIPDDSQASTENELASTEDDTVSTDGGTINGMGGTENSTSAETTNESASEALTRVTFDITVPVYVSTALQVQVLWNEIDNTAAWVTDESWILSADLPADTDDLLTVIFSDQNGAITLGSFEQNFRTGSNPSELFQITADQFDTNRWDDDGDGVSNIEELIAGSDPTQANTTTNTNSGSTEAPFSVSANIELIADKTFRIRWQPTSTADFYRVLENPDGVSGFTAVSGELDASTEFYDHRVGLHQRVNARYIVEACNSVGCTLSAQQLIEGNLVEAIGYLKASNPGNQDLFGSVVSISGDGNTLAVSAPFEDSAATGVNGDQADDSVEGSGAVYIFTRSNNGWQQQAYLKASNPDFRDLFGSGLSLSADGNTLAVGAHQESSNALGVNGDQDDNSLNASGAVYVFIRNGGSWQQQAYLKAGNTEEENTGLRDEFGTTVSLSEEGNTLAVGARLEGTGAVYVFMRSSGIWQQQAYIKASRSDVANFGRAVSLSADGNVLATSVRIADSNGVFRTSEVYIFTRVSAAWQEEAIIGDLASTSRVSLSGNGNTLAVADGGSAVIFDNIDGSWQEQASFEQFGRNSTLDFETDGLSMSADGNTLAIGNSRDSTRQTGLQGFQGTQPQYEGAGAVHVFTRGDGSWLQEVYVKASNTSSFDAFGVSVSLSANGNSLAVGARVESGMSTGFNGDQTQVGTDGIGADTFGASGAVYLY